MKNEKSENFSDPKKVLAFFLIEALSGPIFFTVYFSFIAYPFENTVLKSITAFLFSSELSLVLVVLLNAMLISYLVIRILKITCSISRKKNLIWTTILIAMGTIVNIISTVVIEFVKARYYLSLM